MLVFITTNCLQEFKDRSLLSKFSNDTIVIIVTSIKSGGESSHERHLMVANCEVEFDQDVLAFGSSFKIEYD
jgi:hypothetical protein